MAFTTRAKVPLLSHQYRSLSKMTGTRFVVAGVFLLFSAVHAHHGGHHGHAKVNVTVYYESLCPDSIKFVTKQLYPALQGVLSEHVNLLLLPYGKSKTTSESNSYKFECHHGPAECRGNKLQACAIRIIDGGQKSEHLGYNKNTLAFVNCMMDKVERKGDDTEFPTKICAESSEISTLKEIESCANGDDGSKYLNEMGELTAALDPALKSVPTIVFNDKYEKEESTLAYDDFVKALCKHIQEEKLEECS